MSDRMPRGRGARLWRLQFGVCVSAVTLFVLGYHAIGEWQRSAALLAQRRADDAVDLLVLAVTRDMRGVQSSVLSGLRFDDSGSDLSLDISGVSSAFARYPYPEAFFATRGLASAESMAFYSRSERSPTWLPLADEAPRFPVRSGSAPLISRMLIARIGHDVAAGRRFATFDVKLQDNEYQVVALLSYDDPARQALRAIVGFMVNLAWVCQHYFDELVAQVVRIQGGEQVDVSLAVVDDHGMGIAGTPAPAVADGPSSRRRFSLLFFDPVLVALDPPPDLDHETWTASATVVGESALLAAHSGARRTRVHGSVP